MTSVLLKRPFRSRSVPVPFPFNCRATSVLYVTRSGKRYISAQLLILRYAYFLVVGPTFGQNRFSILCVSMDHQLTPRVGAASFRLSHGLLRLLERELFIIYLQNTERDAIKLY